MTQVITISQESAEDFFNSKIEAITRYVKAGARKYMKPEDAAEYLTISVPKLKEYAERGEIPRIELSGRHVYYVEDLDKFMMRNRKLIPTKTRRDGQEVRPTPVG